MKRSGMRNKLADPTSLLQTVMARAVLRKRQQQFPLRTTQLIFSSEACARSAQGSLLGGSDPDGLGTNAGSEMVPCGLLPAVAERAVGWSDHI